MPLPLVPKKSKKQLSANAVFSTCSWSPVATRKAANVLMVCVFHVVPCSGYTNANGYACRYTFVLPCHTQMPTVTRAVTHPVTLYVFFFRFKRDVHPRYLCALVKKATPKKLLLQHCLGYNVDDD